jgi:transposase-like protein
MPQKKHKPEEIVAKLRQVDILLSQGRSVGEAVRSIGVTQITYYRWRKEFGGLKGDQVKRLKELEKENDRLRKAVSDLTLEKLILKEAASENFQAQPAAGAASIMSWRGSPYRSALPARFSDSTVRPSARSHMAGLMKRR